MPAPETRSPTPALLLGLIVTLAAVVGVSWYITRQISGLRALQTELADRNRRDSLQLLRIQNDLNQLGAGHARHARRERALSADRLVGAVRPHPRSISTTRSQRRRKSRSPGGRPSSAQYLGELGRAVLGRRRPHLRRWRAAGREDEARAQIRLSLQARQAALSTAVARLLVAEQRERGADGAAGPGHLRRVQRQVYWFLAATLVAIAADQPVSDSLEPAAVRAARRRSRTSGASWRSS